MHHATIVATGSHLPGTEITNDALRARFPDDRVFLDKMEAVTGIRTRWYAPDDWAASDLALPAAKQALARAHLSPEDLDMILVGTDTPDYPTPSTSVILQHKLGAKRAGTFDVGCACASFPTGLAAAAGLLATNASMRHILVVGVYAMHKFADPKDPTLFFYGDGAGAAIVSRADRPGFVSSAFAADGAYAKSWGIFAGGSAEPTTEESVRAGRTKVRLFDRYPPEVNDEGWPRLMRGLAKNGGFALGDVRLAIFTQVRKSTIEKVMDTLSLPMARTHTIMETMGYTGSACVAMALDDALAKGKLASGDLVTMVGSGVGYNQAAVAFRMP